MRLFVPEVFSKRFNNHESENFGLTHPTFHNVLFLVITFSNSNMFSHPLKNILDIKPFPITAI